MPSAGDGLLGNGAPGEPLRDSPTPGLADVSSQGWIGEEPLDPLVRALAPADYWTHTKYDEEARDWYDDMIARFYQDVPPGAGRRGAEPGTQPV